MRVYKKKAEKIFGKLLEAYARKEYPYNLPKAAPPQIAENMPRKLVLGTREHALFLFTLCYWMRGGIASHTATKRLARIYDSDPELFLAESAPQITKRRLFSNFKSVGLGFNAKEISGIWHENLLKLSEQWNGDPRNLFVGISTYEQACGRIQNVGKKGFRGFQEKMVSMLTYFFMDAGFVDPWHFPIPVDFHVLRMVFAHGIVTAKPNEANGNGFYTRPILAAVRKLLQNYCTEHDADPLLLCNAVWLFSQLMCKHHPGNRSITGRRHGRKTELWPVKRWSKAQTRSFERTCGACGIKDTCAWCIPSAEYYIRGKIVLRERRDEPPQGYLFSIIP